jgi:hypothetical protein
LGPRDADCCHDAAIHSMFMHAAPISGAALHFVTSMLEKAAAT